MEPSDKVRWCGVIDTWVDQGYHSENAVIDPGAATVHADTGQLSAGYYDFEINGCGNAAGFVFSVVHRNAANTADLAIWVASFPADGCCVFPIRSRKFETNERLRVTNVFALVGTYAFTINWRKRTS